MTNAFYDRVIRKGIVDTRKYRYVIQRDAIDMTVAWISGYRLTVSVRRIAGPIVN